MRAACNTDGWVDGWMNGWMEGWMDGWMEGRMAEETGLLNDYRPEAVEVTRKKTKKKQ